MTVEAGSRRDGRDARGAAPEERGWRPRLKRWFRLLRDARTRRLLRTPPAGLGRVVMASTGEFPNPNHAFVYQEMLGLAEASFDVRILCGERRSARHLANRFRPLLRRAMPVETLRELHDADLAALDAAHPGRVDAFLQRVGAELGRGVDDLRRHPLVLRACTFARLVEIAGARYLQSWFFYDLSFMTMFAAEVLGVPRGISCHVDHNLADHPFKLIRLHLATAALVLAISERTKRELVAIGGPGCAERIVVKRIGIDAANLRPLRDRAATAGGFVLLSVCRIEPKKGLLFLLEACALLLRDGHDVRCVLVGGADPGHADSADSAATIARRAAASDLADRVVLLGALAHDRVAAELARAHVFVAPYVELPNGDKDGIPTSLLEAMAAGLPVICSDVGAIREAVADGAEGLLVPQRDPAALAAAIERLITDADLRARLGRAAAARFDREFDCRVTEAELHRRVRGLVTPHP